MAGQSPTEQNVTEVAKGTTAGKTYGGTTGASTGVTTANIPAWLQPLVQQSAATSGRALSDYESAIRNYQIDPTAWQTLQDTAGGAYLAGDTDAQRAFVDASMRAAAPGIHSAFGAAGRAGSGLWANAGNQAAIDAFAQMYGQERGLQQQAAMGIPGLQMLPFQLQQNLASMAGSMPGQFSPFLGHTQTGQTSGTQFGTSSGNTTDNKTTTTPLHEQPDWMKYASLGAAGLGFLAAPVTGGATLAPAMAAAGGAAPNVLSSLLGSFR